jgi:hypothetical protein
LLENKKKKRKEEKKNIKRENSIDIYLVRAKKAMERN